MALGATIYSCNIQLADTDRGVYETLALHVAQHPSEAQDFLVARLLAYCLEYSDGIAFSKGLSTPDEPAIMVRDLTGQLMAWIDVGVPSAERLHRASKAAARVAVYTHKDPALLLRTVRDAKIYRAQALALFAFDRDFIARMVQMLDRRLNLELTVTGRHLYVSANGQSAEAKLETLEA